MYEGSTSTDRRRILGSAGEWRVARWYRRRGYRVVDRNWRCSSGELDLIVVRADTVVFCEVKTRTSSRYGYAVEAVTPAKQRRIRQLAVTWLKTSSGGYSTLRFDVAGIDRGAITVIEAAF